MTIIFRVNYRTRFGQSLWLVLRAVAADGSTRDEVLPMRWIHPEQWQLEYELVAGSGVRLEYAYQLREDGNGLQLDEWGEARVWSAVSPLPPSVLLSDTWRSAGTFDYMYETKVFDALLPPRGPFVHDVAPSEATHTFGIHVAAVPGGHQLCLCGDAAELGAWDFARGVPMVEVGPNAWRCHVRVPAGRRVHYKYGIVDRATGKVVIEGGDNRVLESADAAFVRVLDEGMRRDVASLFRGAGVVVPVFSLRSDQGLGVGEFADLKPLADWCSQLGLGMIQILPVNDTSSAHDWTDSYPYSAISVFALHPLYLRVDDLAYPMPPEFGIELAALRQALNRREQIDYEQVMAAKWRFTRDVFDTHREAIIGDPCFQSFITGEREWLLPYAAFCVLRDRFGTADFNQWGDWAVYDGDRVAGLLDPSSPSRGGMLYHQWLQYELDRQLGSAVGHLHARGVVLKGDLPIGIDRQSADAWSAPQWFKLDAQAGAPPDAFAVKGQNWGFPTYDWDRMRDDNYAWWRTRFSHLSRYFDAFRIDHILGFFRIWQVPLDQVEGIMGWFDPAVPVHIDEFRECRIPFDYDRFCRPHITREWVDDRFGPDADEVIATFLVPVDGGGFRLRDRFATQRGIVDHFAAIPAADDEEKCRLGWIRQGLLDCVAEVLFFEVPGSGRTAFHPRFFLQKTTSFENLDEAVKERVDALYVDYFFRRQDFHWMARGYEKLPAMRRASRMLLCGEDLGLVPDCVPQVLQELGILSLEIQRMPKTAHAEFGDPLQAPYLSVVSPSTHDMSTLRAWWQEDAAATRRFAWLQYGDAHPAAVLDPGMAAKIIGRHFASPAMWAVVSLQDLLAIDGRLRHPDPAAERINEPAVMPWYWRYRCHLGIGELLGADDLNAEIRRLLEESGRVRSSDA